MTKYDEAMQLICDAARFKMTLNSHKGEIEHLPIGRAIELCGLELAELEQAAKDEDWEKVLVEAADAFNFIVAMAYSATHQYRKRKHGKT